MRLVVFCHDKIRIELIYSNLRFAKISQKKSDTPNFDFLAYN